MTPIEQRAKRIIETPLGSRVMLPNFGSKLFELVDKNIDERYRLQFIAYTFEAFYNTEKGELWDKELEPQQLVFNTVNDSEISTILKLTSEKEIAL